MGEKAERVEQIKPYSEQGGKTEQVREMFDSIAPAYDFMNHAMTMGIDKWWRRVACRRVAKHKPEGMLEVARKKVADKQLADKISFEQGDSLSMRFADGSFDAVTVAFGVRNFEHIDQGYKEMYRVLGEGGVLCVVELSTPRNRVERWFYDLYTLHIIPSIGSLKSGDKSAYRYLPQSIAAVPQGDDMLQLMRDAGFKQCRCVSLTMGTCSIYTAVK